MADRVRIGLIQAKNEVHGDEPVHLHKEKAIEKHVKMVRDAAAKGAQIVCLQEIFTARIFVQSRARNGTSRRKRCPTAPQSSSFAPWRRSLAP